MRGAGGRQEVVSMAWPLAVGMLSFTVMGVTDTILMGQVGTDAQAGVGLGATMVFLVVAFFRGITSGAQSLVAAADGAGDALRVRRAAGSALLIGVITGGMAAMLALLLTEHVLVMLTPDIGVLQSAESYMTIRGWALPISVVSFGMMSVLQGLGDTRIRMWASCVGNAVNIVLDCILIFGWGPIPAMGASGAALATVAGLTVMCLMYSLRFRRVVGRVSRPSWEVFSSTVRIGFPAGAQAGLGSLAFASMTVILARIGAAHLAASQIALNIISVSFLPGYGLGEAAGVLVGRYVGARRPLTADRAIRSARTMAFMVMGGCALVFWIAGSVIVSVFTRDPEVCRIAEQLLLCAAVFQLFDAAATVNLCVLRSVGDTRFTFCCTALAAWLVLLPLVYVLGVHLEWGAIGAWCGMILELACIAWFTHRRVAGIRRGQVGRLDLLLGRS